MSIKNELQLANTKAKLDRLEARFESRSLEPCIDEKLREATLASLKSTINQFKEEIVRYLARKSAAPACSQSQGDGESSAHGADVTPAAGRALNS